MLYRNPRSSFWWSDFAVAGKRYRRSTGETDRQLAALKETELIAAVVADVSGDRLDLPGVQSHVEYRNQ